MKNKIIEDILKNKVTISLARKDNEDLQKQLKDILIFENKIKIRDKFKTLKNELIYVCNIELDSVFGGRYELKYQTKKLKKDGSFGLSWDNSWGYTIEDLLKMEKVK